MRFWSCTSLMMFDVHVWLPSGAGVKLIQWGSPRPVFGASFARGVCGHLQETTSRPLCLWLPRLKLSKISEVSDVWLVFLSSNLRSDIVKDLSESRFLRWTVCNFARVTPLKESGARNARCQKICGDMVEIWDSSGGHWERSMGYPDISTSLSSAAQQETDQITLVHLLVLQVQLSLRSLMWRRPSFAKMSDSIRLNLWHGLVDEYMLHTMPPCPILFQTDWDIRSIWSIATSETLSLWNMPMEMLLCCDRAVAIRCARPFQDHESRSLKCLRGPKTTKTAKLKRSTWQQISDIIFLVMNTEYTYHISLENLDLIPDSLCRIICFCAGIDAFSGAWGNPPTMAASMTSWRQTI